MIPKVKKSLPKRANKIEAACRRAKKRDKGLCLICNKSKADGFEIDAAHILPRNSPFKSYDPADVNWIMSLCRMHHMEYDKNKNIQNRIGWLKKHTLIRFAERLEGRRGE